MSFAQPTNLLLTVAVLTKLMVKIWSYVNAVFNGFIINV